MRRRMFSFALAVCLVLGMVLGVRAAGAETARVVFESSEADANGCFTMDMKVYNAKFSAFQFVLWYDPETVVPVDASGKETDVFSAFATKRDDDWMATIGTSINTEKHLIDFTGYVTPGMSVAVDATEETGKAIVGESGLELFTFRFKKVGDGPVKLALASKDSGLEWQPYLPEGGAVVDAGIGAPLVVELRYPAGLGENEEIEVVVPAEETPEATPTPTPTPISTPTPTPTPTPETPDPDATADELLNAAVFLKIGGHAAVVKGGVTAIYPDEPNVTAYAHDERTFVPVRFVAEKLGAKVDWENDTQTAVITKDGHTIRMKVGALTYTVDGVEKTMDVPAEFTPSVNNEFRTMAPVRFVTEALGYQVEWDQSRNLAVIIHPGWNWDPAGETEAKAMDEAVRLLTMYGSFV